MQTRNDKNWLCGQKCVKNLVGVATPHKTTFIHFRNKVLVATLPPSHLHYITRTCLYNFDPLKSHFYIVKLGFTGVYIFFIFLLFFFWLKNIDCGYWLEPPRRSGSNEYPQSMFWAEIWKYQSFLSENFHFFWRWNFLYIWIGVFSWWYHKF